MKLTFTTSLALLTAASASSANGGGLRSRRLSLFAEDSSKKGKKKASATRASTSNAKADKSNNDDAGDSTSPKTTDPGSKSAKGETKSNVIGGAKAAKAAEAANLKMESARPYYGLETEEDLYYFGDKIEGSFELNDETLSDAAAANFNATLINDYKIGMFPFMGRPNCAGNPAIIEVPVTIADGGTADPIDFEGTFSIDTSIDFREEGTGFDLYLMDEDGCNEILGPLAVTITLTPEEQKAEDEAAELRSKSANTPRAKAEKGKAATVKKTTYKKKKKEVDPKKITVKSKEALSTEDYELATNKVEYEVDEDIVVNYIIVAAPTATAEGRRLKKNKKNKDQPESEPITDAPEDEPVDEPVDEPMEEQVDEPVSDQPEPELQPDPVVSEDDEEEEGEQQPDLLPTDLAIEEATVSDPTDITKFKLGVFMKMANPQHGKLLPLHEVPLCTSDSCTAEEISTGSITISAADLDTSRYGSGYDIWILDDSGDGIAGPVFFAIDV
eukprot:CAMPEP_0113391026 /NCGR_PEP_ID=MMETSP0013_2-20120614/10489_1 /TAXON_ID=2843 ORGANISM="Skeletonema costatum, Strain 1716" /NCGR_SAMPLE_ID=MMETSP0013_2 /ASSEMBLY_ACC=CAM_ASM_000158 /LENGTH=500 /DNA_ID=CAMNT_0000274239 /DNA_START=121 /DNA_END=1623 /DNA_ORIENTATION=+ /assembly_acc=CAM_ASM_000158